MAEMKVKVPPNVEKKFRRAAKTVYGDQREAIDKAAAEAFEKWSADKEIRLDPSEDRVNPGDPIFSKLTIAPKTGKSEEVARDHDKYLYGKS